MTNNDLQNTTQKTKDRLTRTTRGELRLFRRVVGSCPLVTLEICKSQLWKKKSTDTILRLQNCMCIRQLLQFDCMTWYNLKTLNTFSL